MKINVPSFTNLGIKKSLRSPSSGGWTTEGISKGAEEVAILASRVKAGELTLPSALNRLNSASDRSKLMEVMRSRRLSGRSEMHAKKGELPGGLYPGEEGYKSLKKGEGDLEGVPKPSGRPSGKVNVSFVGSVADKIPSLITGLTKISQSTTQPARVPLPETKKPSDVYEGEVDIRKTPEHKEWRKEVGEDYRKYWGRPKEEPIKNSISLMREAFDSVFKAEWDRDLNDNGIYSFKKGVFVEPGPQPGQKPTEIKPGPQPGQKPTEVLPETKPGEKVWAQPEPKPGQKTEIQP